MFHAQELDELWVYFFGDFIWPAGGTVSSDFGADGCTTEYSDHGFWKGEMTASISSTVPNEAFSKKLGCSIIIPFIFSKRDFSLRNEIHIPARRTEEITSTQEVYKEGLLMS